MNGRNKRQRPGEVGNAASPQLEPQSQAEPPTMRVYLEKSKEIVDQSGTHHLYAAPNFYEVESALANALIADGFAKPATSANVIIESPAEPSAPSADGQGE